MLAALEPAVALHGVAETIIFVVPAPPGALQNTSFVVLAPPGALQNNIFVKWSACQENTYKRLQPPRLAWATSGRGYPGLGPTAAKTALEK